MANDPDKLRSLAQGNSAMSESGDTPRPHAEEESKERSRRLNSDRGELGSPVKSDTSPTQFSEQQQLPKVSG